MKFDRITSNPRILNGQPCIRGMRLSVKRVVESVATYGSIEEVIKAYPELNRDDIHQALAYAAASLSDAAEPIPMSP